MWLENFFKLASIRDHHYCTKFISDRSIILDFGSCLGEFSKEINIKHKCSCYAVEALPENFNKISINEKIKKFNYAISNYNGTINFYTSKNPEAHSIFNKPESIITIQVLSVTFESFIERIQVDNIDLIKLDIEGAEIQLFDSTSNKTLSKIKQISIEFHDFINPSKFESDVLRIIKRLEEYGGFYQINFSRLYHYDVLFLNRQIFSYSDYIKIKYLARFYERLKRKLFTTFIKAKGI